MTKIKAEKANNAEEFAVVIIASQPVKAVMQTRSGRDSREEHLVSSIEQTRQNWNMT